MAEMNFGGVIENIVTKDEFTLEKAVIITMERVLLYNTDYSSAIVYL